MDPGKRDGELHAASEKIRERRPLRPVSQSVLKRTYLYSLLRAQLWIKPTLMSLAALTWVGGSYALQYFLPDVWQFEIEKDTLTHLFGIVASTMLTVATFSVTAMVAAFSSVAGSGTPRATAIVMQDRTAQNALGSFIATFIYSIVGLVALSVLSFGSTGRLCLFAGFALSVGWVLLSFLRWVNLVTRLGRLDDTIERVERAASTVLGSTEAVTGLGGLEWRGDCPPGAPVKAGYIGYVRHIDVPALQAIAKKNGRAIWLQVRPGMFTDARRPLALVEGTDQLEPEKNKAIRDAFSLGDSREISVDPRFGLVLLAEVADRALSPALNDPGTAIAIIGRQLRLLSQWHETRLQAAGTAVECTLVHTPALRAEELLNDAFVAISRDGAPIFEVGVHLQKAFASLVHLGDPDLTEAARLYSRLALEQALPRLGTTYHRDALRALAAAV